MYPARAEYRSVRPSEMGNVPGCAVDSDLDRTLGTHEGGAVLQRLTVARDPVRGAVEVGVAADVRGVDAQRPAEVSGLRAPAVRVELVGVFADGDLRRVEGSDLHPHAVRRRSGNLELADFEVPVVLEEVVVADPRGVQPAGLVAVHEPLLHVIRPVVAGQADGVDGDVAPYGFVRVGRRRLRIVVRLIIDPERNGLLEDRCVHVGVLRALDVSTVRVQGRHRGMTLRTRDAVRLSEGRHGEGRRAVDEDEPCGEPDA